LIKFLLLIVLLFFTSCFNDEDKIIVSGEEVYFAEKNFLIDKKAFEEGPNLDKPVNNINWPQKGGNKLHSLSNVIFNFPLKENWSFDTDQDISEDYPFLPQPVSFKDDLFILNSEGVIFCIDKKKGLLKWKKQYFENEDTLLGNGSIVYNEFENSLIAHNGKNTIVSININNKKIIWSLKNDLPFRGSITISNSSVFVNDYEGNLININNKDGYIIWKRKLGTSQMSIYSDARPIIGDKIIINPGPNGLFHILDLKEGNLIHSDFLSKNNDLAIFNNNDIIANPIIYRDLFYLVSHSGTFASFDKSSFETNWTIPLGSKNTPVISGGTIFILNNLGSLMAINNISGKIRWITKFVVQKKSGFIFEQDNIINYRGPYLVNNKLLIFSGEEELTYINPKNGKVEKKEKFNELAASPLFFTNHIIFLFSDGTIARYNSNKF